MKKFAILSETLDFIEENLTESITPEMCAEKCCYSLSNLQKMFRCAFHIGIADYISRRRLTMAARELIETDCTVLQIALKYGYNSHEVFTRAFVRLWGVTPKEFRKSSGFYEIYPKLAEFRTMTDERGNIMSLWQRFDVSHLYDYICERRGKYALCFDMVGLQHINDTYGRAAGDIAIAEGLRRIDSAAGEGMLPMRIGGDEFVLITDLSDRDVAQQLMEKILSENGKTCVSGNSEFPVSLRADVEVIPDKGNIRYNELFEKLYISCYKAEHKEHNR